MIDLFLQCFVCQGSRGHARGWVPPGRLHRRVDNGCHSSVLCLSTAGEDTWVELIAETRATISTLTYTPFSVSRDVTERILYGDTQ